MAVFIHSTSSKTYLPRSEPRRDPVARCAYCGRTQERKPDGGCVSCGAPLPSRSVRAHEHNWLEVTVYGDPRRRFICSCGAEQVEESEMAGFR